MQESMTTETTEVDESENVEDKPKEDAKEEPKEETKRKSRSQRKIEKQAKELKDTFNLPAFYDFDRDWSVFNTPATTK
jgi:hypothetical protein